MICYSINKLSYFFPHNNTPTLCDLELEIQEAEFVLLLGPSGSGKSVLARLLAHLLLETSGGSISGSLSYRGTNMSVLDLAAFRREAAFLSQDPAKHFIFSTLQDETTAFLENLGLSSPHIRRRQAELISFFGLKPIFERPLRELSGGELQKAALACSLSAVPRVLILDEPTSQLSPSASRELLMLLSYLNINHGTTVILTTSNTDEVFPLADKVVFLNEGRIVFNASPAEFAATKSSEFTSFVPAITKAFAPEESPLSLKEAIRLSPKAISAARCSNPKSDLGQGPAVSSCPAASHHTPLQLEIDRLFYSYPEPSRSSFAVKGLSLSVPSGEIVAICGDNGAGKSTLLRVITGELSANSGRLRVLGKDSNGTGLRSRVSSMGYLPQHYTAYFSQQTVQDELGLSAQKSTAAFENIRSQLFFLLGRTLDLERSPLELSSGEQHALACTCLLSLRFPITLLDEPTTGCDRSMLSRLARFLKNQTEQGASSIIFTTQDLCFAEQTADRVLLLSSGELIEQGPPAQVFSGNLFYTTLAKRLERCFLPSENLVVSDHKTRRRTS